MSSQTIDSLDGTAIAFETVGNGPPLVLVGGAFSDRSSSAAGLPLAKHLAGHFTVLCYDRRGRGESGDTPSYAIEREVEDLDALIRAAGGSAFVYGLSSGGLLALNAAVRQLPIPKLALYEVPLMDQTRANDLRDIPKRLATLSAVGNRVDAVELFLTRVMGVPAAGLVQMRSARFWSHLEALAHTLSYDVAITLAAPALLPLANSVRSRTIAMAGGKSAPWMHHAARTLADRLHGRYENLEGQTHDVDVRVLAEALQRFLLE